MKIKIQLIYCFCSIILSVGFLFCQQEIPEDKHAYLPKNMTSWEHMMWGKEGLIRKHIYDPGDPVKEMKLRVKMLQTHQKLGLLTLAMLSNQSWMGWELNEKGYDEGLQRRHRILGFSTFGVYMTTAGFSLFAPPAQKKKKGLYSIKLHKTLAWIHFTGMLIQPWLGIYAGSCNKYTFFEDFDNCGKDLGTLHNTVGMITTVSFSLAFLTTLLP